MVAALACLNANVRAEDVKIEIEGDGFSQADAQFVLEKFRRNCRPLGKEFWSDVTEVKFAIADETAEHRLARGWTMGVHLTLKYSDQPLVGPSFASGTGVLAGHTLHYDLGGGKTPGFLATKRSSQYLCGLSFDTKGNSLFVPVPEFEFLDP